MTTGKCTIIESVCCRTLSSEMAGKEDHHKTVRHFLCESKLSVPWLRMSESLFQDQSLLDNEERGDAKK